MHLKENKKVLLHACCAPCLTYSIQNLEEDGYEVVVYFYNPNIHPESEYEKRLGELVEFCKLKSYELVVEQGDTQLWYEMTDELKEQKEGGKRCAVCFEMRLNKAAKIACEKGFGSFCTTLTISPHKNTNIINTIGEQISKDVGIEFLHKNFKKKDGFKKSLLISDEYNMFRQTYCGCEYSIRK